MNEQIEQDEQSAHAAHGLNMMSKIDLSKFVQLSMISITWFGGQMDRLGQFGQTNTLFILFIHSGA